MTFSIYCESSQSPCLFHSHPAPTPCFLQPLADPDALLILAANLFLSPPSLPCPDTVPCGETSRRFYSRAFLCLKPSCPPLPHQAASHSFLPSKFSLVKRWERKTSECSQLLCQGGELQTGPPFFLILPCGFQNLYGDPVSWFHFYGGRRWEET